MELQQLLLGQQLTPRLKQLLQLLMPHLKLLIVPQDFSLRALQCV
jgi:hypothetical protein